jgi:ABC-type bacteriocin/lantibiotic exporter with double-glycine peptidase domain
MKLINRISLGIALLCILFATTISILAIWNVVADRYLVWRALATLGVIFLATILAVIVNSLVSERDSRQAGGER